MKIARNIIFNKNIAKFSLYHLVIWEEKEYYLILDLFLIISLIKGFQEGKNIALLNSNTGRLFKIKYFLEYLYIIFIFINKLFNSIKSKLP